MSKKANSILSEILEKITPSENELEFIKKTLENFVLNLKDKLKSKNINAEIFIGGSYAKNTLIKKDKYDIDIFLRYNKKYPDNKISEITSEIFKDFKAVSLVHGSRDYFRIKINDTLFFEIIPVMKVGNPKNAENITDLSYSHVKYINKKVKNKKVLDEIKLAKAFCYANHCYGAESYINGFSGYGLELLISNYGSFLKFLRAVVKAKPKEKIIIDIEKSYKNKKIILMDLNESKLKSPVILIDPTYKQRNTLAALSEETFNKFKVCAGEFLKNPTLEAFELKKTDLEEIKQNAEKKKNEFILVEARTDKQEGDVAGSKLFKFYRHLISETEKFFDIKSKGFNYNGYKSARYFFVAKAKKEILFSGPSINDEKNIAEFKKKHPTYFSKKGKLYAKEVVDFNLKEFILKWILDNRIKIKEMYIIDMRIIE